MLKNLGSSSNTIKSVKFTCFNSDEIKKLSVLEVTNPNSLDRLLNPTVGGLYDSALGASSRDEICSTCGLGSVACSGHLGYIKLPLPVYNPMFYKNLYGFLRGSCFQCRRFLIPRDKISLYARQLEVASQGMMEIAQDLTNVKNKMMEEVMITKGDISSMQEVHDKLNDMINDFSSKYEYCKESIADRSSLGWSRNASDYHQQLIKEVEKLLSKKLLTCPNCLAKVNTIRSEHNTKFYISEDKIPGIKVSEVGQIYLTPGMVYDHMKMLWDNEKDIMTKLCEAMCEASSSEFSPDSKDSKESNYRGLDVLFLHSLPVTPSRFRPLGSIAGSQFENCQSTAYSKVITDCQILRTILKKIKEEKEAEENPDEVISLQMKNSKVDLLSQIPGNSLVDKLESSWLRLQQHINQIFDSDSDRLKQKDGDKQIGVKQLLEKKEGLFRKNMMGKRVNFAARSVISPDPYIATNEIGLPLVFATRLTYPTAVTSWNFQELRQAVMNGPKVHPGATKVISNGRAILLDSTDPVQREAIAKQLVASNETGEEDALYKPKTVLRHIKTGDVMLVNRQPTLHKGSIMAHKVRVLPGEKTLRLHYANCKSYNADFDGDEMNAHFPQSELSRSEAYGIMLTDKQYLSGKDGKPLSCLIQDHMVAGVNISIRGRFFSKEEYQQLIFSAFMDSTKKIKLLHPAILKPQTLWSGKQVFSTLLLNIIPDEKPKLNLESKSKIRAKNWQREGRRIPVICDVGDSEMCESEVIIRGGELVCGVLDKAHYGASEYGLVHAVYELYGGDVSGRLLTSLARVFTTYLQFYRGFTLGVEDILVVEEADETRKDIIKQSTLKGPETVAAALNLKKKSKKKDVEDALQNVHIAQMNPLTIADKGLAAVDHSMKKISNDVNDNIANKCTGSGLLKTFPHNNLQLMVISGAKGGMVNCIQISCLLGQIELEGRRPPLMPTGRSVPSFKPYDMSLRAGGFVSQRFLTGIRPQEYFYHCMAGREGLIDTAVKTSRSGYLQRCLIKHLEGLLLTYDMTVRDSDGSVIQFTYGEDGVDVTKSSYLKDTQTKFIVDNQEIISDRLGGYEVIDLMKETSSIRKKWKKFEKIQQKLERKGITRQPRKSPFLSYLQTLTEEATKDEVIKQFYKMDDVTKNKIIDKLSKTRLPDSVISQFRPDSYYGSISEKFYQRLSNLSLFNPSNLPIDTDSDNQLTLNRLQTLLKMRYQRCLVEPGESVGLIAAQSIGEPSTQMTLNTFHFAGRGDMNVTLGIPRLREILMVGSRKLKTPQVTVPVLLGMDKKAKKLCRKLTRFQLSQVLHKVEVEEVRKVNEEDRFRQITIRFQLLPEKQFSKDFATSRSHIIRHIEKTFVNRLVYAISRNFKKCQEEELKGMSFQSNSREKNPREDDDDFDEKDEDQDGDKSDDGSDDDDEDAAKKRKKDDVEYEESDEDEEDEEEEDCVVDEEAEEKAKKEKKEKKSMTESMRAAVVTNIFHGYVSVIKYSSDTEDHSWCEVVLKMPLNNVGINVISIVRNEISSSFVRKVHGITRAILVTPQKREASSTNSLMNLITEGINFPKMFEHQKIIDVNKLYSNDIHSIADTYGIEAARRVIVKEITDVFAVYGIEVDPRHLGLIGDFMCFNGSYQAFNRRAMTSCASPLQQMSFETTLKFLNTAALTGAYDQLQSPSSRIVTGQLVKSGTGHFELVQPLTT